MKKILFFLFSCVLLICCDDNKDIEELTEIMEEDTEITTRADVGINSFTGEKNLQVGLRTTYTVKLAKPLAANTTFRIYAGNSSAARFATITGTTYSYGGFIEIDYPISAIELKFDMLPIKPVDNMYISITSATGAFIDGLLTGVKIVKPTIQIEAPSTSEIDGFISVKVPYSYALFGDKIIEYSYDQTYLRYGGTTNSNTGYNSSFYARQKLGNTKIKALIKGKINSMEYYEIASTEHNVLIENNSVPDEFWLTITRKGTTSQVGRTNQLTAQLPWDIDYNTSSPTTNDPKKGYSVEFEGTPIGCRIDNGLITISSNRIEIPTVNTIYITPNNNEDWPEPGYVGAKITITK